MSDLKQAFELLDLYVRQRMQVYRTPGIAVALTDREKLLRVSTYGVTDLEAGTPVTPDTLFETGSIGKSFTAIAMLQAREAGLLDLHAPVSDYLPWFRMSSRYEPITVHHLLTHSAGIISGTDFSPDARSEVWALRDWEPANPPGQRFHYSNVGYKALGLVLQEVMGQPYGDIIKARILDPLGMAATVPAITHEIRPLLARGYRDLCDDRPPHNSRPLVPTPWLETDTGDGCIASTAEDMARYVRMLLNRGRGPDGPILSEASYDLLTRRALEREDGLYYGYGIATDDDDGFVHIGHAGSMPGYQAFMRMDVDNGLGAVVLETHPWTPDIQLMAVKLLRAAYLDRPLPSLEPVPDHTRIENAAAFEGTYEAGDKTLALVAEGERLLMVRGPDRTALEERGADCFYANCPDFDRFLFRFGRAGDDENGVVVEAFHGSDWYTNDRYAGPTDFEYPSEWDAYPGHYRSHNPWETNFRVVLRKGRLLMVRPSGDEQSLTPLEDGGFRVGEESSPERLRFDQVLDGQAQRANLSGCDHYRFFTP